MTVQDRPPRTQAGAHPSNRLSARLYDLLPALYRIRDAEQGGPLQALVEILAEQIAVLEEDLDQLYDDQFIETCAEWVVPYIGDLVGARAINDPNGGAAGFSARALVANTLRLRRRKGTASALEQLAHDVTDWDARVVEYFQLVATTQYLNRLRPAHRTTVDLHDNVALEALPGGRNEGIGSPLDTLPHTADVRRIASGRARHNLPNVGVFLWRLRANRRHNAPATRVGPRCYTFGPAGGIVPLFNRPEPEMGIEQIAGRLNLPMPITRRQLGRDLANDGPRVLYGPERSLDLIVDGVPVPATQVRGADLSTVEPGVGPAVTDWAHTLKATYLIDPELGRIATPPDLDDPKELRVTFHYGAPMDLGGGEYSRQDSIDPARLPVVRFPDVRAPILATLQDALDRVADGGAVEIATNDRYVGPFAVRASAGARIEIRAADGFWPTLDTKGLQVEADGEDAIVTLNGLLIASGPVTVAAAGGGGVLARLRLRHCTLVPGLGREVDGGPASAGAPSLTVQTPGTAVEIDRCILGPIQADDGVIVAISDSIVDADDPAALAYSASDAKNPGGVLHIERSTIVGRVHATVIEYASDTIFQAEAAASTPSDPSAAPVRAERLQQGCVRFSYVPPGSRVPRRHACRPASGDDLARVRPRFTSLRYGDPAYGQLAQDCPPEIGQGASNGAEMGVFHDLYQPQRAANLRARLDEFLRFSLEAGVFYAT